MPKEPLPLAAATASSQPPQGGDHQPGPPPGAPGQNREEMEKSLIQSIYGMNHGINSYPTGVAQANPFLHPAMFSATGKSAH